MDPRVCVMYPHLSAYIRIGSKEYTRIHVFTQMVSQMYGYGFTFRNRVHAITYGYMTVDPGGSICVRGFVCIRPYGELGRRIEYVYGVKDGVHAWIRMDLHMGGDKCMDSRGFSSLHVYTHIQDHVLVSGLHDTHEYMTPNPEPKPLP